mgnify:CR=1 FL=1
MSLLKPKDLIAVLSIVLVFALISLKSNHSLDVILTLILGYYFGHRASGIDAGN